MTNQATTAAAFADMRRLFTQQEPEFRREAVKFSLWQHGGGPGRGFTSDLIELRLLPDRTVQGTFTRTHFDRSYEPPFLAEQFSGPVSKDEAEAVLGLVFSSNLFGAEHPSERDPSIGGVMKEEWELGRGPTTLHKTFFRDFPPELSSIRDAAQKAARQLEAHGEKKILHPKR